VQHEKKEHWMTLCQRAAVEQDPERLLHLIAEITRMLDEKEDRLRREQSDGTRTYVFRFLDSVENGWSGTQDVLRS
jgi:hypothetical protein